MSYLLFTIRNCFIFFLIVLTFSSCNQTKNLVPVQLTGQTMGSIAYNVKYLEKDGRNFKEEIDSLLILFNRSLSTYIPDSEISRFNKGTILKFESPFFFPVLMRSKEIHDQTGGAFDPTIAPLVNAWGFGPEGRQQPDSLKIDSLLRTVNFRNVYFDSLSICKLEPGVKLDLSAIAKGYAVDLVADLLVKNGVENLMVEIGGEAVCKGKNFYGDTWAIGIDDPLLSGGSQAIVHIDNRAIATSGNYRNFYEKDGIKYSHTISPFTGYPVQHSLLSASVFASDCMTADAFATAFMVLGLEESIKILEHQGNLDAFLIYNDKEGNLQTHTTEGIKENILIR